MEPRVKFFKNLPRIGGYVAAAVPAAGAAPTDGFYQAILAADTLLPQGTGQAFSPEDVKFIWDVAQGLGKALAAASKRQERDMEAAGTAGSEGLLSLKAQLAELSKAADKPDEVPEGKEKE
jgi:hypothetical protein